MKSAKTSVLIIGLIVMMGVLGAAILFSQSVIDQTSGSATKTLENQEHVDVMLGGMPLRIVIADTTATRYRGLSGIQRLEDDEGMLFVFDRPDILEFWMKDMEIPLDIMWFDEEGTLIHIEENLSPETYPTSFAAPDPALYVLEVRAGFIAEHEVQVGTPLAFDEI